MGRKRSSSKPGLPDCFSDICSSIFRRPLPKRLRWWICPNCRQRIIALILKRGAQCNGKTSPFQLLCSFPTKSVLNLQPPGGYLGFEHVWGDSIIIEGAEALVAGLFPEKVIGPSHLLLSTTCKPVHPSFSLTCSSKSRGTSFPQNTQGSLYLRAESCWLHLTQEVRYIHPSTNCSTLVFQVSSLIKNIKYILDSFFRLFLHFLTVKNWFKNYYEQSNSFHKLERIPKPGIPALGRGQDTAKVSRALSGETETLCLSWWNRLRWQTSFISPFYLHEGQLRWEWQAFHIFRSQWFSTSTSSLRKYMDFSSTFRRIQCWSRKKTHTFSHTKTQCYITNLAPKCTSTFQNPA